MTYICNCACSRCLAGSCCWAPPPMHNWNPGGESTSATGGWAAAQRLSEMHAAEAALADQLAEALRRLTDLASAMAWRFHPQEPELQPARIAAMAALAAYEEARK